MSSVRTGELFERITQRIIAAIEAGAGDDEMPWHRWGQDGPPINAVSGRAYRGINALLLWAQAEDFGYSSARWATYRQWASAGANVRKGERATAILFWKAAAGKAAAEADPGEENEGSRLIARTYFVFNADQVDGAPLPEISQLGEGQRIQEAETFLSSIGAQVRHGGDRACYVPSIDQIWLPHFAQFRDAESYYAVLAHECVHWTGAKHRLDRNLAGRFGSDSYAAEELVAELGSAFITAHLQLTPEPRRDHAAYIDAWLRVLRADSRAILTAAAHAQRACDYLIALNADAEGGRVCEAGPGRGIFSQPALFLASTSNQMRSLSEKSLSLAIN